MFDNEVARLRQDGLTYKNIETVLQASANQVIASVQRLREEHRLASSVPHHFGLRSMLQQLIEDHNKAFSGKNPIYRKWPSS